MVGFYAHGNTANDYRAFQWRHGGAVTTIQRPDSTPVRGTAFAVSGDGLKVLGTDDGGLPGTDDDRPFLWTEGEGIEYLDFLPGLPYDMSADASVIVGNVTAHGNGYRWSQSSGLSLIDGYVTAVSDDGAVVVGYGDISGGPTRFVGRKARVRSIYLAL